MRLRIAVASGLMVLAAACGPRREARETKALSTTTETSTPSPDASASAAAPLTSASASASPSPLPREVASGPEPAPVAIKVPNDKKVFALFGDADTSRVVVYLHGRCGDPLAFSAWSSVVKRIGTVVSLDGEVKCDGGRTKWSPDTRALDKRITRAIELAEAERGKPLDASRRLVIGYSAGALRAEALATTFPDRYPRVVLIGGPRAPKPESLKKTEAILLMAGQLDIRQPLMDAATDLAKAGRNARFILIPHAHHGEYGPEAETTMQSAFEWVLAGEGATASTPPSSGDAAPPRTSKIEH